MKLQDMVLAAMNAGLRGDRLPNLGDWLTREEMSIINSVYEEARNWNAGSKHRAKA